MVALKLSDAPYPPQRRARRPRTYFWRRLVAILAIAALGAVALSAGQRLVAGAAIRPGATHCNTGEVVVPAAAQGLGEVGGACGLAYIARPGDTVWSVAVRYSGGGDPRPLEDVLQAEVVGSVLQPGQQLVVPR